jgi:hypothetical protein
MINRKLIIVGLALLAVTILTAGLLFASQAWRCPNCGQSFPWDPRDPGGLATFKNKHMAACRKKSGGGGSSGGGSSGGASSDQLQAAGQLGNAIGQALREMIVGNPEEQARKEAEAARAAEAARQMELQRQADLARKNQEIFDNLQTKMQGPGFDGDKGGLTMKGVEEQPSLAVKLGDSATADDGLRPRGTPIFGLGGGPGGGTGTTDPKANTQPTQETRLANLSPQQGYTATPASPASPKTPAPVDSKAVDLRHMDPNRPIVVDPNMVKGRERVFSVQVSKETLNNPSYQKGCEAFMNRDPASALRYFQQVQQERPGDPLVRAQILLAQDLIAVKANKETGAYMIALEGMHAARNGNFAGALVQFQKAHDLYPQEKIIARWMQNLEVLNLDLERLQNAPGLTPREKATEMRAMNLAGNAMVALMRGDYSTAQVVLEAAQKIEPQSKRLQVLQEAVAEKTRDREATKTRGARKKIFQED